MKLHKNLLQAVYQIIHAVMFESGYADRTIERTLKANPKWGSRDRSFIAETSYDIIRHYRLLNQVSGNRNDLWNVIAAYLIYKNWNLPVYEEFSKVDRSEYLTHFKAAETNIGLSQSYTDDWVAWFKRDYPDTYEQELKALNEPAKLVLRVNSLKINKAKLKGLCDQAGNELQALEEYEDALLATRKWNVFQDPLFKSGYFEIQDASSQCVAAFMDLKPGMRVIDACAGAGGKTLHMAALMKNKGHIIALDTEGWKLEELRKRARRAGAQIIETRTIDSTKVIKRLHEGCDRLLLDVPCSGTGVIRRNPDAKWKIDQAYVERMLAVQRDLLNRYSLMLRPGGKLVYATCSVLHLENSEQIAYFCNEHPGFQLEEEIKISPFSSGFDGFYMARLKKI
ncbi:MAG: RsmB/NOP family class I SAM-dependent RNA methyltransferase [Saprospiraceae bacterium]|nr:RsmB/NOP family class I SAM-dependent RNA methyltransferase [Saprospiraceae bacterium]